MRHVISTHVFIIALGLFSATSWAEESSFGSLDIGLAEKGTRGISVIRNENPSFLVRVQVNHPNHLYTDGDLLKVNVVSEQTGYLYLLYRQANQELVCLFPNKYQQDNKIEAHHKTTVPTETDGFQLQVGKPYGQETLLAIVSKEQLNPKAFGVKSLIDSTATAIDLKSILKAVDVRLKSNEAKWAEHQVSITTVPSTALPQDNKPKKQRLGLFVGISKYMEVRDLKVSHRDAQVMAKVMMDHCQLDGGILLTDENATLAKIRQAFQQLKAKSRPGDEVFVFWSGHGGRCADTNKDEEDGYDEFLVPHDAGGKTVKERLASVLMDDTFGRWIQDFDGCRVIVLLDTCNSGGQSASTKNVGENVSSFITGDRTENDTMGHFDFLDSELSRTKDIGQEDAAMLCSSNSDEVSHERQEGDLSVMTYYLLQKMLQGSDLTLQNAYQHVKTKVPEYFKKLGANRTQTTIYVNQIGTVYVRP